MKIAGIEITDDNIDFNNKITIDDIVSETLSGFITTNTNQISINTNNILINSGHVNAVSGVLQNNDNSIYNQMVIASGSLFSQIIVTSGVLRNIDNAITGNLNYVSGVIFSGLPFSNGYTVARRVIFTGIAGSNINNASAGITLVHNLNNKYVSLTGYDANGDYVLIYPLQAVTPNSQTYAVNANSIHVKLDTMWSSEPYTIVVIG